MSPYFLALSLFAHLIATVVWLGGLVILALLVWPEARRVLAESPALYRLLSRLRQRFLPWMNFSLVVLIFTGLIQMAADPNYDGMLQFTNEWSLVMLFKHIAFAGMVISGVVLQALVIPALERATLLLERGKGSADDWARLRRREVRLTWIMLLLSALVLGFTAWATAL